MNSPSTSPRFSKFIRPDRPRPGAISDRDLDLIEAVLRYRFSPTSELIRLVGGNEDVTMRRLRALWERRLLNRFAFPFPRPHSEFIYYLDRSPALDLLVDHGRLTELHPQMEEDLRLNQEADYASASVSDEHMKLGFLRHSLMISRMHFMLEMAGRKSASVTLASWSQGAELRGHKVEVPEINSRRVSESNHYVWREHNTRTQRLPVEPDALFALRVGDRLVHFCYEADRGTMPMTDMLKKLRAYYHFIKRQQKHRTSFGVHPIRAVLIETTTEARALKLMQLCQLPAVLGDGKRSALFWFAISPLFTASIKGGENEHVATYLIRPEVILSRLWAMPDLTLHALGDEENSTEEIA